MSGTIIFMMPIETNCDLRTLARRTVGVYMKKTRANIACLRVPRLKGLLRPKVGMLLHYMPEMFFQLEGVNIIELPDERFHLLPGELCIIPRCMPHNETVRLRHGRFSILVFTYDCRRLNVLP